jgi:hypothetical protein
LNSLNKSGEVNRTCIWWSHTRKTGHLRHDKTAKGLTALKMSRACLAGFHSDSDAARSELAPGARNAMQNRRCQRRPVAAAADSTWFILLQERSLSRNTSRTPLYSQFLHSHRMSYADQRQVRGVFAKS